MDIKQEPLDDPESKDVVFKNELFAEPLTLMKAKPNVGEINQETHFLQKLKEETETENVHQIHSQINQKTTNAGCLYTIKESVDESTEPNVSLHAFYQTSSGIKLEIPEINDGEFEIEDFCVKSSDLVNLKQELDLKHELLTEECDLSVVKNEESFLNEPCYIQQFLHCLTKNTRTIRKKRYLCPVCQKDCFSISSRTKHLNRHFGKNCVTCCISGKMFIRRDEYFNNLLTYFTNYSFNAVNRTLKNAKTKNYPVKCEACCKLLINKLALINHLKEHIKSEQSLLAFIGFHNKLKTSNQSIKLKLSNFKLLNKTIQRQNIFSKRFNQKNNLKLNAKETFECNVCFKAFSSKKNLNKHAKTHSKEKPFKCEDCFKAFSDKHSLNKHARTHTKEKPFKCEICLKKFSDKSSLKKHLRKHTGEKPFKCDICLKSFSQTNSLALHSRTHSGEKPFQCDICLKTFSQKAHVNAHAKTHTGEKPFKCEICFKMFPRKDSLVKHVRTHTEERPFQCEICFKKFRQRSNLLIHARVHTGENIFECKICLKTFSQKNNLVRHNRIHTDRTYIDYKPFKCTICLKSFSLKNNLVRHSKIHTEKKPFQCEVCLKTFSQKALVVEHARTHIDYKPFECSICLKSFTLKKNLVRHAKIHTEKKNSSEVCSKTFSQKAHVVEHAGTHL